MLLLNFLVNNWLTDWLRWVSSRGAFAPKNWGFVANKEKYFFSEGGLPSSKGRTGGTPKNIWDKNCKINQVKTRWNLCRFFYFRYLAKCCAKLKKNKNWKCQTFCGCSSVSRMPNTAALTDNVLKLYCCH